MFYSHEVLTSRKHGVATVWLVATLGAKSNLKRIHRKQILDVDVEKACQTIIDPVAPMALRLQGNLLYGVSRVYLQQCGYVLSDAQSTHSAMRMLLRTVQDTALDPDARKARPEQLVLPEDPSFLPEFAHSPPDLLAELDAAFFVDILHSEDSQSLTPFCSQQPESSHAEGIGGLVLPPSSPSVQGAFRFEGDNELDIQGGVGEMFGPDDMENMVEPDFTFGDDGDMIEFTPRKSIMRTPRVPGSAGMSSNAGASAQVRREHEEGQMAATQIPGNPMDLDLPVYGDDLPEGEAFSPAVQLQISDHPELTGSSSSTVAAPMRRKPRTGRTLPIDTRMELRNKDLADWNTNYLQNMKDAVGQKIKTRATIQAKKNAEYLVWGAGIGGIAGLILGMKGQNPFDIFIGDNLFKLITGLSRKKVAGSKHDCDSDIDEATQKESRRVRQKTDEPNEELGRGLEDEGFHLLKDDEIELPREAGTALDDQEIFSAMPWNASASVHRSSVIPRSSRLGTKSSIEHGKRGSRLVYASPLFGRGQHSGLQPLENFESDGDEGFGGDEFAMPELSSDYLEQSPPPQASVGVGEALHAEGENFLSFVTEAIIEKRSRVQADLATISDPLLAEAAAGIDDVTFIELLPPQENTKAIACQGLMMVLALGTKGMLEVQQPEHFGDIGLKLTAKAKVTQVIEISEVENGSGENEKSAEGDFPDIDNFPRGQEEHEEEERSMEVDFSEMDDYPKKGINENKGDEAEPIDEDDGHFQEQFAAGTVAHGDDDRDFIYDN